MSLTRRVLSSGITLRVTYLELEFVAGIVRVPIRPPFWLCHGVYRLITRTQVQSAGTAQHVQRSREIAGGTLCSGGLWLVFKVVHPCSDAVLLRHSAEPLTARPVLGAGLRTRCSRHTWLPWHNFSLSSSVRLGLKKENFWIPPVATVGNMSASAVSASPKYVHSKKGDNVLDDVHQSSCGPRLRTLWSLSALPARTSEHWIIAMLLHVFGALTLVMSIAQGTTDTSSVDHQGPSAA